MACSVAAMLSRASQRTLYVRCCCRVTPRRAAALSNVSMPFRSAGDTANRSSGLVRLIQYATTLSRRRMIVSARYAAAVRIRQPAGGDDRVNHLVGESRRDARGPERIGRIHLIECRLRVVRSSTSTARRTRPRYCRATDSLGYWTLVQSRCPEAEGHEALGDLVAFDQVFVSASRLLRRRAAAAEIRSEVLEVVPDVAPARSPRHRYRCC